MGKDNSKPDASAAQANPPAAAADKPAPAKPKKKFADGEIPKLKLVLVGDAGVGKSCLITNYLHNTFTENYEPTVLDVYTGTKSINKMQVELEIHDTSGDDNLAPNRKVQYSNADVFMVCVAKNDKNSFANIGKWKNEINSATTGVPIFLILTKSDMDTEDVSFKSLKDATKDDGQVISCFKTSSKEWDDFNVHKAFNKTLAGAIKYHTAE